MSLHFPSLPLPKQSRPVRARSALTVAFLAISAWAGCAGSVLAQAPAAAATQGEVQPAPSPTPHPGAGPLYIREYRVEGAKHLPRGLVERAVYPYLGPGRDKGDVEGARAALEKAYREAGYQTVTVQIPEQSEAAVKQGVVMLQVMEITVGRLRVKGSRYFLPSEIVKRAPSLHEGGVMNFNEVTQDIVALNKNPDLRVTPSLRPGVEPNTVDIDLDVKDTPPLHGSLELNNRYSSDTQKLRLNGAINYNNLWQLGHSVGASFQVAPEDVSQVNVYSGYYTAHFPDIPWLALMLQGTKQNSTVSTLGGAAVAGRGEYFGPHAIITLPNGKDFYHSFNFGIEYKHFDQNIVSIGAQTVTPISYYPISGSYCATWMDKKSVTELNGGVNLHLRGMGSSQGQFDTSRYDAQGNFIYFRGDLSHTHELPGGVQAYGKVQGQIANQPLINNEQFSAGGLDTVRGYIESTALADNALCGTLELRSPSLGTWLGHRIDDWRFFVFTDGGVLTLRDALPEQTASYKLASYGVGSRMRFRDHLNGSFNLGMPLISQGPVNAHDLLFTFRLWADF